MKLAVCGEISKIYYLFNVDIRGSATKQKSNSSQTCSFILVIL